MLHDRHPRYLNRTVGFLHGFFNGAGNRFLAQGAVEKPHMKLTFGNETPGGVEDSEWQGFINWFQAFEKSESVSVFAIIEC